CNSSAVYYASAAKEITAGADYNKTLTATVASAGSYYFKVVTHYGSGLSSSASRQFTVSSSVVVPPVVPPVSSGGGGGGGGGSPSVPVLTTTPSASADINHDGKINTTDISILTSFLGAKITPQSSVVDLNNDGKINVIDLSILIYQLGKSLIIPLPPVVLVPVKSLKEVTPAPVTVESSAAKIVVLQQALTKSSDLSSTSIGNNVKVLQQFLNAKGFLVAKTGLGSPGQETLKFGAGTWTALIKFQKANGLPASGVFDAKTRAFIKKKQFLSYV
ncbi:MAG: peptidoglycan-binding protein, partial [Candidatus Vogelbacteria bacterium]|nr:peptidoglycan-binding protein [Candidatus Vogelbacteria bacterium]